MNAFKEFLQENKDIIVKLVFGVVILSSIVGGCSYLNQRVGVSDDNPIEEYVEEVIKKKTGFDLDLTPNSKEK